MSAMRSACAQARRVVHSPMISACSQSSALVASQQIARAMVSKHPLAFWDAMLWAAAQRAGVRHLLTEDLQDGFSLAGVRFVNPFDARNNRLIDEILPPR
jgi:predicted nucleic acid-binding protein